MTPLSSAARAYESMADFRSRRQRLIKFAFGQQWDDLLTDRHGGRFREGDRIVAQGHQPVTVNLLRRFVRTIVGRFRNEFADTYSSDPASVDVRNALPELDARLLEEFIISGAAIQRVVAERRPAGAGVWIDNVDPRRFFVNPFSDPRGSDITLIGMFHDLSWPQVMNMFGHGNHRRLRSLEELFRKNCADPFVLEPTPSVFAADALPIDPDRMRVVEIWTFEPRQTAKMASARMCWMRRHVAPDGTVLAAAPSEFPHGSHPFAVKLYPLIDGRVHSFLEDLIHPQKAVNRLLTSFEASMSTAAKGVLLFPQDQLVRPMGMGDVASLWARPDAVIPIVGRGNDLPQQLRSDMADSGIVPIIEMQLRLLEEASGISDTIASSRLSRTVGAEAAKEVIVNANAALADIIQSFRSLLDARSSLALRTV